MSNGQFGISIRCFRCDRNEFVPHGERSVAEILKARAELAALTSPESKLPRNMVPLYDVDVPSEARVWGLKCGLSPELLSDTYGFRWIPSVSRVLVPTGPNAGFARAILPNDRPKYMQMGNREYTAFLADKPGKVTVVTEDALSAIKVSLAGYRACALMSTAIKRSTATLIAKGTETVVVWTDPDRAGIAARAGIRKSLALYPVRVVYIETEAKVDPKYSDKDRISWDVQRTIANR